MAEKKRIAIIGQAIKLPGERQGLNRLAYIADMLGKSGYDVDLYTSSFQHWEKKHRETWNKHYRLNLPYKIVFIDEPGYDKNLDLRRITSHKHFANEVLMRFERDKISYDLIYCLLPPNDLASKIGSYAKKHEIPFIVDVSDLWPEAMKMVLDIPGISSLIFKPFSKDAKNAYRCATAAVGTSEEYATRPLQDNPNIESVVVYVGNDLDRFDDAVLDHEDDVEKPEDEIWITYAGTLGKSYDITTMCRAVGEAAKKYPNIKGKILGDGPDRKTFEAIAKNNEYPIEFLGYQNYEMMCAYLSKSDILVNSLVESAPQSIVSKVADYLAAGKPIINTGLSEEFCTKVTQNGFGINVEPENTKALTDAIDRLIEDPDAREKMGTNGRRIAELEFDRKICYKKIKELIDKLA